MQHWVLRDAITGDPFASQDEVPEDLDFPVEWDERECYWALESYTPRRRPVVRDWWTPSPMHGDGWYWCADTGAWEDHWVLPPLAQSEAAKRDLIF